MLNHNKYLNIIRRITGASFVGWISEKDKKSLKVTIKGVESHLPLIGTDITQGTYAQLINHLLEVNEEHFNREGSRELSDS